MPPPRAVLSGREPGATNPGAGLRSLDLRHLLRLGIGGAAFLAAAVLVLELHGFAPGKSDPPLAMLIRVGTVQCLHRAGLDALRSGCTAVGAPIGAPLLTGAPEFYLA